MKKFILTLVMMLSMGISTFAEDSNTTNIDNIEKYEFSINYRRLACVLDMSIDQMEMTGILFDEFANEMKIASTLSDEEDRNRIMNDAINKNAKYMSYILNKKQYGKYMMLFNLTLKNRGLIN